MLEIEYKEKLDEELCETFDGEFEKYAVQNGVVCNYAEFSFVAKDDDEIAGVLTGHSYYNEVHISDLVVFEKFRNKNCGKRLVKAAEDYHQGKGFKYILLFTYGFQAPEFYKKCGFQIEHIQEDKENPKLTKYYFIKRFASE